MQSTSHTEGAVRLFPAKDAVLRGLDRRPRASDHHAVVVLRDEDKPVMQVLNLPWVDAGTKRAVNWLPSLGELLEKTQTGVKNE